MVPAGAMTALGGKPQTTRKARALHAPYAPQGFKPITPSPARGRGKRAGDPARGYWEGSPKPPSPKRDTLAPLRAGRRSELFLTIRLTDI